MTNFPKPFFRTARQAWFVQVGGRQINLGSDRDAVFRRYHEVMGQSQTLSPAPPSGSTLSVMDAFLDWSHKHKAPRTYGWYRRYLESFGRSLLGNPAVAKFKPFHVQTWLDSNSGWTTGKRGVVIAVQRAFNWVVRMGLSDSSLVRSLEKPKAGRRERVITTAEYAMILAQVNDNELRELPTTCWETG